MFCISCGTQLPDEANFCWKCGKPQKESAGQEQPRYDYCEIVYAMTKKHTVWVGNTLKFWARALGPQGKYNAGESPEFKTEGAGVEYPKSNNNFAGAAHKALVESLVRDGWEPTGERGDDWYADRFRRRARE